MRRLVGTCSLVALALCGCVNQQKAELAAGVAKNWCLAIRASQVLPTYPLTEDLQPGDLFLSQQPIEDDVKQYQKDGFLPLTHLVARLPIESFPDFYRGGAYGVSKATTLPTYWQFGRNGPQPIDLSSVSDTGRGQPLPLPTNWSIAPRGSFPSYSFSVDQSVGFKAGLPLNGVPIALGVLGSDHAEATVTLGDAYTYGIDEQALTEQVRGLIEDSKSPAHLKLKAYEPMYTQEPDGSYRVNYTYLRLVTRVYYVKKVTVTVRQTKDWAGNVDGGVAQNLKLFQATTQPTQDFKSLLDDLNSGLSGTTSAAAADPKKVAAGASKPKAAKPAHVLAIADPPADGVAEPGEGGGGAAGAAAAAATGTPPIGASLKFANVTGSSVTMDETFDRPLVIGYLAVDIPIDYDGKLGTRPISTIRRIERAVDGTPRRAVHKWAEDSPIALDQLTLWVGEEGNADWLAQNGYPVVRDAAGNVDDAKTAGQLLLELRQMDIWHSLFTQAFDRNDRHRANRLNARIIGEILERPAGTGVDVAILARRSVNEAEAAAAAIAQAPAAQRDRLQPELDKATDKAQSTINRLSNPNERQRLQIRLQQAQEKAHQNR
jgi:hypothetical protein